MMNKELLLKFQMILIPTRPELSAYVSTTFVSSEKEEDLRDGIIIAVTPFMANSLSKIRVDRAPGFAKMSGQKEVLDKLGIEIELGEAKNKNSLAIADQKIKELRQALKKISPSSNVLNQTCLSRATTIVNEKIRHHKLSAKEIHFSRDSATNEPIQADDKKISEIIQNKREADNSSRSNSSSKKKAVSANAAEGQLVFIKAEGDKRARRDLYLVLERNAEEDTVTICKVRDALSNKLASMAPHDSRFRYIVKQTEVMLAPNQPEVQKHIAMELDEPTDWEEEIYEPDFGHDSGSDQDDEMEELWFPTEHGREALDQPNHDELNNDADEEQEDSEGQIEEPHNQIDDLQDIVPDIGNQDINEEVNKQDGIDNADEASEAETGNENTDEASDAENDEENEDTEEPRGAAGGQQQVLIIDQVDQSRKPNKGDIVAFVQGNYWVRAKIKNKVTGYPNYYNVELEDGTLDGVYLKPQSGEYQESWTLLPDPHLWNPLPTEQLRSTTPVLTSRQATPVSTHTQERLPDQWQHEDHPYQDQQLMLDPTQQLQEGRVHMLPHLLHIPQPATVQLQWPPGTDPTYARRVEEIANSNFLPPSQDHLRIQLAMHQASSEARRKEKSISTKVKKAFNWGKK